MNPNIYSQRCGAVLISKGVKLFQQFLNFKRLPETLVLCCTIRWRQPNQFVEYTKSFARINSFVRGEIKRNRRVTLNYRRTHSRWKGALKRALETVSASFPTVTGSGFALSSRVTRQSLTCVTAGSERICDQIPERTRGPSQFSIQNFVFLWHRCLDSLDYHFRWYSTFSVVQVIWPIDWMMAFNWWYWCANWFARPMQVHRHPSIAFGDPSNRLINAPHGTWGVSVPMIIAYRKIAEIRKTAPQRESLSQKVEQRIEAFTETC